MIRYLILLRRYTVFQAGLSENRIREGTKMTQASLEPTQPPIQLAQDFFAGSKATEA